MGREFRDRGPLAKYKLRHKRLTKPSKVAFVKVVGIVLAGAAQAEITRIFERRERPG
jgi:hypothetical protein